MCFTATQVTPCIVAVLQFLDVKRKLNLGGCCISQHCLRLHRDVLKLNDSDLSHSKKQDMAGMYKVRRAL